MIWDWYGGHSSFVVYVAKTRPGIQGAGGLLTFSFSAMGCATFYGLMLLRGIVNLFVEKKMIDELKRGKGVESNERLGILSC